MSEMGMMMEKKMNAAGSNTNPKALSLRQRSALRMSVLIDIPSNSSTGGKVAPGASPTR